MDFFQFLVLVLHTTQVFTKSKSKYKKYQASSSDEGSIENLLYYKDCQRTAKEETTTAVPEPLMLQAPLTPPPPPQPACQFPKMCCALTCGNECGNAQNSFITRQEEAVPLNIQPPHPIQPVSQLRQIGMGAIQPQLLQRRRKKIKMEPNQMQPLIGTRRDFSGFTKEKIKGLISQDDDIRKILKDLVRVTMQKVDLLDMMNTEKSDVESTTSIPENNFDEYDE